MGGIYFENPVSPLLSLRQGALQTARRRGNLEPYAIFVPHRARKSTRTRKSTRVRKRTWILFQE